MLPRLPSNAHQLHWRRVLELPDWLFGGLQHRQAVASQERSSNQSARDACHQLQPCGVATLAHAPAAPPLVLQVAAPTGTIAVGKLGQDEHNKYFSLDPLCSCNGGSASCHAGRPWAACEGVCARARVHRRQGWQAEALRSDGLFYLDHNSAVIALRPHERSAHLLFSGSSFLMSITCPCDKGVS